MTLQDKDAQGKDCAELYHKGVRISGVYTIILSKTGKKLDVYCDMKTDGGGWTVFQRRMDGTVDFYRNWQNYKYGFGNLNTEFWLGNDNIYFLTTQDKYELRVDMQDAQGSSRYAQYHSFAIGSEADKYRLAVRGHSGTAGDDLTGHNGLRFSTKDNDNDNSGGSCSQTFKGAWWYGSCHGSNLNGMYYLGDHSSYADGVGWASFRGRYHSLRRTEMKIRPQGFKGSTIAVG
ncbi:ficolin-1-like [Lingula anatina]|uniref:Ficolin-1-like n=1 Tax=Lingula anatina TaxID=7574 RepID=A0A1S3HE02_LINAN|nr:ficolin-1-like [Lingula anatina]|eukprot:XP_013384235.1 ficolin-1-like [Lingula anatina]